MRTIRYAAGAVLATVLLASGLTAAYAETTPPAPSDTTTAPAKPRTIATTTAPPPKATPTTTPTTTVTPKTTPTTTPTPKATPTVTPKPTPTTTPPAETGKVTATYGCGTATFHNGTKKSVLIHYGPAQSDALEGSIHIDAGKSYTVKSTNEAFGWTAWPEGDQTKPDVGHLYLPGKNLHCDDTTVPPGKTPKPNGGGGLANTGN